ncbi:MAG TPA: AAA family ATPase [Kofleriaceae bacterium]|nr:AAA family ATPase [Kofleriaceae bacterium]
MVSELSGRPLRDTRRDRALFVDREQPLRAAEKTLRNGGNVLLVGSRGSGKSSLVRMIAHQLSEEDGRPAVVVDGRAAGSVSEFLALLRDQLGAWPTVRLGEAASTVASAFVGLANDPQLALRPSSGETQALLSQLREFGRSLPAEGKSVVLVDEMPSPESAHTLFGRLRDELWELPLVWLVAADERDVGLYREPPADAFWQRVVPIPELDSDSAAELLRRRLDPNQLPDAVLAQLVEAAGGNPRRLISLAYDVVVEGADPSSVIKRDQNLQQQISDLTEPAKRLLAEVEANGAASPSDQALLTKLGWTRSRASQVFRELEQQGLVRPLERPGPRGRPRRLYEVTY